MSDYGDVFSSAMRSAGRSMDAVALASAGGVVACTLVGLFSAWLAVQDLAKLGAMLVAQARGQAQGTDFLNLYAGASLLLREPSHVYDLQAQLVVQQQLTAPPCCGWPP